MGFQNLVQLLLMYIIVPQIGIRISCQMYFEFHKLMLLLFVLTDIKVGASIVNIPDLLVVIIHIGFLFVVHMLVRYINFYIPVPVFGIRVCCHTCLSFYNRFMLQPICTGRNLEYLAILM